MRKHVPPGLVSALALNLLIAAAAFAEGPLPNRAEAPIRVPPAPETVSPELARLIEAPPLPYWKAIPETPTNGGP